MVCASRWTLAFRGDIKKEDYMAAPGAGLVTAPGWTAQAKQDLTLIDSDIHQTISKPDDLYPYMPEVYREQMVDQGLRVPSSGYFTIPLRAGRNDLSYGGDPAKHSYVKLGDDFELFKREHLDVWNVDYALLTGGTGYGTSTIPDPDFGAAICRAFNDWTLEHWAARDGRLIVAINLCASDPQRAIEEIDRLGDHPKVKAVMLPSGSRLPYGNRFFHPIWRACEEHGLVVGIHPGAEGAGMAGPPTGVGYPTYYIETRMARPQMGMAHAVSLIAEGVFVKFPRLRFLFNEMDQFWAVGLMWHMDADWKSLREQTPWLKRLPSEYFREHVRIGSQPMLEPERHEQFFAMLDAMYAEETLVYCSDWPHFDWDDPATTFPRLPERLHRRVFVENARELFGL
jgi:predicted TIM-barrel fold metal-dependent hydrolase